MKKVILSSIVLAATFLFAGCEKDNYDAPTSVLNGRVVFQGQPVGVRSNGVQLELWQGGYQLFTKIPIFVAQDGTFSASLFDGNYKLTRLRGNGPWADASDTINITVKGTATIDVPVDPFFLVRNETITRSGTTINARFNLQRVNTTRNLEFVRLYVGQTLITDAANSVASANLAASSITDFAQPINMSIAVPASLQTKDFVYARVGVKTLGIAELAYSQPIQIMLK